MNEELELQLIAKYPDILKLYKEPISETCMGWGMECDDGWYNLLDECLEELEYLCHKFSTEDRKVEIRAEQIKEKFGTLRFYTTIENATELERKILNRVIDNAETDSANICEVTGNNGKFCKSNTTRWYKTLCREEARRQNFYAYDQKVEEFWKEIEKNEKST